MGTLAVPTAVQFCAGFLVGAFRCGAIAHIIDYRASPAVFGNRKVCPRAHERPQVCLLRILGQTREESLVIEIEERRIDPGKRCPQSRLLEADAFGCFTLARLEIADLLLLGQYRVDRKSVV